MLLNGRTLRIVFKRNHHNDHHNHNTTYSGYDTYWPNGQKTGISFNRFCTYGTKTIFGHNLPNTITADLLLIPINHPDTPKTKLRPHKTRRLYMLRTGPKIIFHLCNGIVTDIAFDINNDAPEIIQWLGPPANHQQQWFDLITIRNETTND